MAGLSADPPTAAQQTHDGLADANQDHPGSEHEKAPEPRRGLPSDCAICQYFLRTLPLPAVAIVDIPSLDFLGPISFHSVRYSAQLPLAATYGARAPPAAAPASRGSFVV